MYSKDFSQFGKIEGILFIWVVRQQKSSYNHLSLIRDRVNETIARVIADI